MKITRLTVGDIDKISQALGAIQSDLTNIKEEGVYARNLMASINGQLGAVNTSSVLMQSKLDAAHARLDKAEPIIERHDTIIGRMIWLGSLIITGVTLLINWAGPFLNRILP